MTAIEAFKRGGAGFTFAEWNCISAEEQAIAIDVQEDLENRRAALVAFYLLNPIEMVKVFGGEDAAVRAALSAK